MCKLTGVWFTDIFIGGKRCILFDSVGRHKHLATHTEIDIKGRVLEVSLVQDTMGSSRYYASARGI